MTSAGVLWLKSDVSAAQRSSGVALGTGWHGIELCGTVGTSGSWDLYRDGVKIVSGWVANTGTTPVGRVEIGDNVAKTFTMNFDDIVVTDTHATAETDPPTIPGTPTGSSTGAGSITIAGRRRRTRRRPSPTASIVTGGRRRSAPRRRRPSPTPVSLPGPHTPTRSLRSTPSTIRRARRAHRRTRSRCRPTRRTSPTTSLAATLANWTGVTRLTIDTSDRPRRGTQRESAARIRPGVRLQGAAVHAQHRLHEHERERDVVGHGLREPAAAAHERERPGRPRLHDVRRGPVVEVRRLGRPEELRRRAGNRVARHRAVRHGRGIRFVGSLP